MEPTPIDVNKLRGILGKSLAVMNKVESTKPIALSETTRNQIESESEAEYEMPTPINYNEEMVRNSNLPAAIKQLMIERPIKQASITPTFTKEDLYDERDEKPFPTQEPKKKVSTQQRVNETVIRPSTDTITISRNQLDSLINERLTELLAKSYSKTLIEETIKKTIKTLITEGKIVPKKKTI